MKKILLLLLLSSSIAKAQYFQRWFNHYSGAAYKPEVFYDGLCTRYNYSGDSTNYYNVGVGFTNVSTNYALGNYDELRFAKTDKTGIVLQNFGFAFSNKNTTNLFNSRAHAVCEIKNNAGTGGYMVVGNVLANSKTGAALSGGSDALIARVLNDGSVPNKWRFNFAGGFDELSCVIASSHFPGYFYACGTAHYNGFSKVIVMKFSNTAKVLWAYTYHFDSFKAQVFANECEAYGIAENSATGELMVAGTYIDADDGDVDGLIIKLDAAGNVITARNHNLGTLDEYRAVKFTNDKNFIICGFSNKKNGGGIYYDMWLTKVNTAGQIIFSKLFRQPNSTSYGLDVIERINSSKAIEYYITGSRYDNKKVLASTSIVKTDNRGNGVLCSAYDTLYPYNYHFMGIDYTANDDTSPGVVVFSNTFSDAIRSDAYMLKANYNLATCNEYCQAEKPLTYNMTIDSGVLENHRDANLIKAELDVVESTFNTGSICSEANVNCKNILAIDESNSKINTSNNISLEQNIPNPFSSITTIKYTLPQKFTTAQIVITNNFGNIVKRLNIYGVGKGSLQTNASSLLPGVYNYSLIVDGKILGSKQMIVNK